MPSPIDGTEGGGYTFIMQPLTEATNAPDPKLECAAAVMDVVPAVMRRIRAEMRSQRMPNLSIPQFRALIYLYGNEGASLSEVADHVGLELPSMSKAVDVLVGRGLVIRRVSEADRRYASLRLSALGRAELKRARSTTEAHLAEALNMLSLAQQTAIVEALESLRLVFAPQGTAASKKAQ
jgi:DNA-binding MarR family transcriptional regulator